MTRRRFIALCLLPFYLFALGFFAHITWTFIWIGWQLGEPPH